MGQDQNSNRNVGALSRAEPKTPLERAKQIQEMQRQLETQQPATSPTATPQPGAQHPNETQAAVSVSLQKAVEVFDAKPVEQVNVIAAPLKQGADQLGYGATQVDEAAL